MDDLELLRLAITRALAEVHAALDARDARKLEKASELTRAAVARAARYDQNGRVREIHELMQRLGVALGALGHSFALARG